MRTLLFCVALSVATSAIGTPVKVVEDDMIRGFKDTSFKVPGFESAENETRLAFAIGTCAHVIPAAQVAKEQERVANVSDDRLRGMLTEVFDQGRRDGAKLAGGKDVVKTTPKVCNAIVSYSLGLAGAD